MNGYVHLGLNEAKKMGDALEEINNKMHGLLNRLPLRDNREVVELAKLAENQKKFLRVEMPEKRISMKDMAFLHAQIDSAYVLQHRYSKELSSGRIRG